MNAIASLETPETLNPNRESLEDLAALGTEELTTQTQRALPATTGQISVAAFQSSI